MQKTFKETLCNQLSLIEVLEGQATFFKRTLKEDKVQFHTSVLIINNLILTAKGVEETLKTTVQAITRLYAKRVLRKERRELMDLHDKIQPRLKSLRDLLTKLLQEAKNFENQNRGNNNEKSISVQNGSTESLRSS